MGVGDMGALCDPNLPGWAAGDFTLSTWGLQEDWSKFAGFNVTWKGPGFTVSAWQDWNFQFYVTCKRELSNMSIWHLQMWLNTHTSSYRVSYLYIFVQCVIIHPGMAFVYLASSNPALLVSSPLPPFPYTPSSSGHRSRWRSFTSW